MLENFDILHDEIERYDSTREAVIKKSRDIVKLSKRMIYAVQRGELNLEKLKKEIKDDLQKLVKLSKTHPSLYYSGSIKIAEQEFVEAICFYEYVKNGQLPTHKDLDIEFENYLLGICDLTGELSRKAINSAIKEKYSESKKIVEFVAELYGRLMQFDFQNGEIRRKFDSIKYDLRKLEDLMLELKLKDKI